jgi:hypothetical protein
MGLKCEQADKSSKRGNSYHQWIKRCKRRFERRKWKLNPEESFPTYGKYSGYES